MMNTKQFADFLLRHYLDWYSRRGESDAFTFMLGVAVGLTACGISHADFEKVVGGMGKLSHIQRIEKLESFRR